MELRGVRDGGAVEEVIDVGGGGYRVEGGLEGCG